MKVNQIISCAIICLVLFLVGGCGDSGPVGQEAVNPSPEDSSHEGSSHSEDDSDEHDHDHSESEDGG